VGKYTADIRVTESYRGEKAWSLIKGANMFNSPAPDGYEYVLVKIYAAVRDIDGGKSVRISGSSFDLFSAGNVEYTEFSSVVEPTPELSGQLYSGDDALFKKVRKRADGIILQPLNTLYEPRVFSNQKVEELPVAIIGMAKEIRRKT